MGATPTIDGIFQDGEWADANTIVLDSTKTIHLKHDKENLYIALDGDGGNIYVLKDDLITILHASFSLGWAEYSKRNGTSWDCQREYNWELYKLQEKTEAEISGGMNRYLTNKGWVASLIPMGNPAQTEYAISFEWLGLSSRIESVKKMKTPRILISSIQNIPPAERRGRDIVRR